MYEYIKKVISLVTLLLILLIVHDSNPHPSADLRLVLGNGHWATIRRHVGFEEQVSSVKPNDGIARALRKEFYAEV